MSEEQNGFEVYPGFNEDMHLGANASEDRISLAAARLYNGMFGIDDPHGYTLSADRHTALQPREFYQKIHTAITEGTVNSLYTEDAKQFFSIPDEDWDAKVAHAKKNLKENRTVGERIGAKVAEAFPRPMNRGEFDSVSHLMTDEEKESFEDFDTNYRGVYDQYEKKFKGQNNRDSQYYGASFTKDESDSAVKHSEQMKLREKYSDIIKDADALSRYEQQVRDENQFAVLSLAKRSLNDAQVDVIQKSLSGGRDKTVALRAFDNLSTQEQRTVAPFMHMLKWNENHSWEFGHAAWNSFTDTLGLVTEGAFHGIADPIKRLIVNGEDYQDMIERRALMKQANEDRVKSWGFAGDSIIGAFSTIPYMAVAAVPYVGVADIIASAANQFEEEAVLNGVDISTADWQVSKIFAAAAYAAVEKAQFGTAFKGVAKMSKRQAYCDLFHSWKAAGIVAKETGLSSLYETGEEGFQGGIEEVMTKYGMDRDVAADFATGFTRDFTDSVGTMMIVAGTGAGTKAYRYRHGAASTAEDAIKDAATIRDMCDKINSGDQEAVEDFGRDFGFIAGDWINAGEGHSTTGSGEEKKKISNRILSLMRKGFTKEQAIEIDGCFKSIYKATEGNQEARDTMFGGRHALTAEEYLKKGVERIGGKVGEIFENEAGEKVVPVSMFGTTLNFTFNPKLIDSKITDVENLSQGEVQSILHAVGLSEEDWNKLTKEEKEQFVSRLRRKGSFSLQAPNGVVVDGKILENVVGRVNLTDDALPQTTFHEFVHGVLSILNDMATDKLSTQVGEDGSSATIPGNAEVKSFLAELAQKFAPTGPNEFVNEEELADAFRDFLTQKVDVIENRGLWNRLMNFLSTLLGVGNAAKIHVNTGVAEQDRFFQMAMSGNLEGVLRETGEVNSARTETKTEPGAERNSIEKIYTGSASDYDKPSLHYVGTGEGSQVYGWGLYGSNQRGVAENYSSLQPDEEIYDSLYNELMKISGATLSIAGNVTYAYQRTIAKRNGRDFNTVLSTLKSSYDPDNAATEKWMKQHKGEINRIVEKTIPKSYVYEQTFFTNRAPGDESHLLNWYEPVSDENVERVIQQYATENDGADLLAESPAGTITVEDFESREDFEDARNEMREDLKENGEGLYNYLSKILGSPRDASEFLARADIDGIKYPVDSYGGKTVKDGDEAGWNYVSFRDDNIRVDHKWVNDEQRFSIAPDSYQPEKTYHDITGKYLYKTMRVVDGHLEYPMSGTGVSVPTGKWLIAEDKSTVDPKTGKRSTKLRFGSKDIGKNGRPKNNSGVAAPYPGFHMGSVPYMAHIGLGGLPGQKHFQNADYVWVAVDVPMDRTNEYSERIGHKDPDAVMRGIIPENGMYYRKTNPNMKGKWGVAGAMKIVKVLGDDDVDAILDKELPDRVRMGRQGGGRFNAETMRFEGQDLKNWNLEDAERKFNGERFSVDSTEMDGDPEYKAFVDAVKRPDANERTNLLAPNGKRSNLTNALYHLVRTKRFKDWFGDWEKKLRIDKLLRAKSIDFKWKSEYELNRNAARSWALSHLKDDYTNNDTGYTIKVDRDGLRKVTSHGYHHEDHLKSVAAIPLIIRDSIFIEERPNIKSKNNYESFRYYLAGIDIDGIPYTVKIVVGVKDGEQFYDHDLTQIEKGTLIDCLSNQPGTVKENPPYAIHDTKIISLLQSENVSKIVDENGEPMVVYHGSIVESRDSHGEKAFTVFETPSWFTREKKFAESYSDAWGGGKLYSAFLNVKNPLDIGVAHDMLIEDGSPTKAAKDIADKLGIPVDELVEYADMDYAENDENAKVFTLNRSQRFGNLIKEKGYDGIRDIEVEGVEAFAAIDPSQIKSADSVTYDDSGNVIPLSKRFGKGDDIRLSVSFATTEQDRMQADLEKKWKSGDKSAYDKALLEFRKVAAKAMPNTKVLDKGGLPMVVYHGTPDGRFTVFHNNDSLVKPERRKYYQNYWFTDNRRGAEGYADASRAFDQQNAEPGVKDVFLNITNPEIIDANGDGWGKAQNIGRSSDAATAAIDAGRDGLIIQNVRDTYDGKGVINTYATFSPSQIKSAAPFTYDDNGNLIPWSKRFDRDNEDIRWSVQEYTVANTPSEVLSSKHVDGVDQDGSVRFSVATYRDGGREVLEKYLDGMIGKKQLTEKDKEDVLSGTDRVFEIAKELAESGKYAHYSAWADATVQLDAYGKPFFSVIRPNGDYKYNIDFSTVCKKRRPLDRIFAEMAKSGMLDDLGITQLTRGAVADIQTIIKKYGLEVACALCFVDSKRYRIGEVAGAFVELWNGLIDTMENDPAKWTKEVNRSKKVKAGKVKKPDGKTAKPTFRDRAILLIDSDESARVKVGADMLLSGEGMDELARNRKSIHELYRSFGGVSKAKDPHMDVPYNNDIIRPFRNRTNPKASTRVMSPAKAFSVGGVRLQSFSDFVAPMFFDYVQMVAEMAAAKLPCHAYTKETLFVEMFGMTGIKINMSLVPAVQFKKDENGNTAFDKKTGFPIVDDSVPAGLDKNGNYLYADECFPPDEAFRLREKYGALGNVGTIMVGISDEHIIKCLGDDRIDMVIPYHKSSLNSVVAAMRGIASFEDYTKMQTTQRPAGKPDFDFYGSLARTNDPRATADEYLKWCEDNGYVPKFQRFATHENYYKLLEDFRLYDSSGAYAPQGAVEAHYPENISDIVKSALIENEKNESTLEDNLPAILDEIRKDVFSKESIDRRTANDAESGEKEPSLDQGERWSIQSFSDGTNFVHVDLTEIKEDTEGQLGKHGKSMNPVSNGVLVSGSIQQTGHDVNHRSSVSSGYRVINTSASSVTDASRSSVEWDGPAYAPSSYAVAFAARDKVLGIQRPDDEYVRLISALDPKGTAGFTPESLKREAESVLNGFADKATTDFTKIAAAAEKRSFGRLVTNILQHGEDVGSAARVAYERWLSKAMRSAKGKDYQDFVDATGIDLTSLMLAIDPNEFAPPQAKPEGTEEGSGEGEAGEQTEMPADQTVYDQRKDELESIREYLRQRIQEWRLEEAKRKARLAEQAAAKKRTEVSEDDEFDEEGNLTKTGEALDETASAESDAEMPNVTALLETLKAEGFDVKNAAEFAALIRFWVEDWLAKEEGCDIRDVMAEPSRRARYRKTVIEILRDFSDKMLDPSVSHAAKMTERMLQDIPDDASASLIERRSRGIISFIQRNAVTQERKTLIRELRDAIRKLSISGKQFQPMEKDAKRKVTGEYERYLRYVYKILVWSDGQVSRATENELAILAGRVNEYGEDAKEDDVASKDEVAHRAASHLQALQKWGGLKKKSPAEIKRAASEILEELQNNRTQHELRWGAWAAENDRLASEVVKAVSARKTKYTPSDKDAKGAARNVADELVNTFRQRLEHMMIGAGPEARRTREEIMRIISQGSERLALLTIRYRQEAEKMLTDACKGTDLDSKALCDKLEELVPEELNDLLVTDEQSPRMTWGQVLQLLVSVEQTATYGQNVLLHGRGDLVSARAALEQAREDYEKTQSVKRKEALQKRIDALEARIAKGDERSNAQIIREAIADKPYFGRLVDLMREVYDGRREDLSKAFYDVTGLPILSPDPLYMPVRMYRGAGDDLDKTMRAWSPFAAAFTPRVKNNLDFDLTASIMDVFHERTDDAAKAIAFGMNGMRLRSVLARREVQDAIAQHYGKAELRKMIEQLTDTLTNGYKTPPSGYKKVISLLGSATTYSALSWNLVTMLKQMTSIPAWTAILDGGYGELVKNICSFDMASFKELSSSPGFLARYGSTDFFSMLKEAFADKQSHPIARFYKAGMTTVQIGDFLPGALVGTGVYKSRRDALVAKGMTYTDACEQAATDTWALIEECQQSSRVENMPDFLRRQGFIARQCSKFATSPLLQISHEYHTARMWAAEAANAGESMWTTTNEAAKEWRRKFVNQVICNHFLMPVAMYALAEAFGIVLLGDEPPDEEELYGQLIMDCVVGPFSRLFLVGAICSKGGAAISQALGGKPKVHSSDSLASADYLSRLWDRGFRIAGDIANMDADGFVDDALDMISSTSTPVRYVTRAARNYSGYDPKKERAKRRKQRKSQGK